MTRRTRGYTKWTVGGVTEVVLSTKLSYIQRRCTLAHELHHVEAGPPQEGVCDEEQVRQNTARSLLPDPAEMGEFFALTARLLGVTWEVLLNRLHNSTASELREMKRSGHERLPWSA